MQQARPGRNWMMRALAVAISLASFAKCAAATPEEVDAAIKKGQDYLYSKLNASGNWEQVQKPELSTAKDHRQIDFKARQWGGLTSIAVYALLASGESPQDPKLKPAIDFLTRANIQSTYGLGLSSQAWVFVPQTAATKAAAAHNVRMLDAGMIRKGKDIGFYGYWTGEKDGTDSPVWGDTNGFAAEPKGWHDLSNSQYAVLGMWALEQTNAEIPNDYWKTVEEAWKNAQKPDGGWSYNAGKETTAAMTAAGIATLFITQDYTTPDTSAACHGGTPTPNIDKGLDWMDKNIEQVMTEGNFYTLYGIERIGVASGRKYFGSLDWYARGADTIVKRQAKDGDWGKDIPNTCFSLLFLARGSAPIMMNKLQYETPRAEAGVVNVWNERPRDAANLARWTGRMLEHDLNWQIVNMEVSPDDLHDAPVLYISGSQQLAFSPQKLGKYREFVEQGGMILGNADCAKEDFVKSFIRFGADLFPQYEFRQIPPSHPIFTHEQYRADKWRVRPNVMGLTNGIRELMVLVPDADASRAWQSRSVATREDMFELGADIFLYAVDKKNLLTKGRSYVVNADPKIVATKKIKVARIIYGPNPDPEPGAWKRFAAIIHNESALDLDVFNAKPGSGDLLAARVAVFTGTTAFKFTDAARLEIKTFVNNGGTLIIDAAGGSAAFAASTEEELRAIFGASAKDIDTPLPKDSAVYNLPNEKIETAGYRIFARESLPHGTKKPMLRGITIGKKVRVFYSQLDITGGLVGQPVDGVYGYDPQTAKILMSAMIRYAIAK